MSFDTLAPYYRGMEMLTAGRILQQCRTAYLAETTGCRHALLLGEGPGRFLTVLLQANPHIEVTCVEASKRMIAEASSRLQRDSGDADRVRFVHFDALDWQPPQATFDLVGTHFFLDCFRPEQIARLVAKIAAATTSEARWLLADFCEPPGGWRRWRAKLLLRLMYVFFRFTTGLAATRLTSPDPFLTAAGFHLSARRLANFGLAHSDLWSKARA